MLKTFKVIHPTDSPVRKTTGSVEVIVFYLCLCFFTEVKIKHYPEIQKTKITGVHKSTRLISEKEKIYE